MDENSLIYIVKNSKNREKIILKLNMSNSPNPFQNSIMFKSQILTPNNIKNKKLRKTHKIRKIEKHKLLRNKKFDPPRELCLKFNIDTSINEVVLIMSLVSNTHLLVWLISTKPNR